MRWGIVCLLLAAGCSTSPPKSPAAGTPSQAAALAATMPAAAEDGVNPSFPVTIDQANQAIKEMLDHRKAFQRPVVVVGGFMDPYLGSTFGAWYFSQFAPGPNMIPVSLVTCNSFADCRRTILDAVDQALPSTDPAWTSPVDVIGLSLGGVAARFAAAPSPDPHHPRRLNIVNLYSISSPHYGAIMADKIALVQFHRDLQTGSAFMVELAKSDATANYQLIPYVLLGDEIVGQKNAAPPGRNPYWLRDRDWIQFSVHADAMTDPRILGDIARRLRGETPFTLSPPAPLPEDGNR